MELAEGVVGRERERGERVVRGGRSGRSGAPGARVEDPRGEVLARDGAARAVGAQHDARRRGCRGGVEPEPRLGPRRFRCGGGEVPRHQLRAAGQHDAPATGSAVEREVVRQEVGTLGDAREPAFDAMRRRVPDRDRAAATIATSPAALAVADHVWRGSSAVSIARCSKSCRGSCDRRRSRSSNTAARSIRSAGRARAVPE